MNKILLIVFLLVSVVFINPTHSQMVSGNVFLKGKHIEVGIAPNQQFGSNVNAPAGYHGRHFSGYPSGAVGFVSDPAKDGWTVGTPDYIGDYFLPGVPQEGWDMSVGGTWFRCYAYVTPYGTSMSVIPASGAVFTGANTDYYTLGSSVYGVWEGRIDSLEITTTTHLDTNNVFFLIDVKLKNIGSTTVNNIYYSRTLDPDNESAVPGGGGAVTTNVIEYVPNIVTGDYRALVSATGLNYPDLSYLGIGAVDCRAYPYIRSSGLYPTEGPNSIESNGSYNTDSGFTNTTDAAVGIVFKIGDMAPGDSTSFTYTYVLSSSDLDSAFNLLSPGWSINADNVFYAPGSDTLEYTICRSDGDSIDVEILGGGAYVWDNWTPTTGLLYTTGRINRIEMPDAPVTYRIIGNNPVCPISDTIYLKIIPVGDTTLLYEEICAGQIFDFDGTILYESGTYQKIYTSALMGCDSVTILNLTVNPLPDVKVLAPETTICSDETALFQLENPSSFATYQWYKDGIAIPGATEHQYMADAVPGEYRVVGVTNKGCTDTSRRITLTVNPAANVDILDVDYGKVCLGDTITFEAELQNGYEYRWTPEKVFRYTSGYKSNVAQGIMEDPETIVTVMGMNKYGCKDYDSVKVVAVPCCEVLMPTVFSPNGDGLNDWFNIKMQNNKQIVVSFQVFDRRGNLVYDNNNQKQGWNGLIENTGSEANQATYFYRVVYTCTDGTNYEVKGDITLVR